MNIIGITGGIGSGKSTVGGYFKAAGYQVIEADDIVKDLLKKHPIQASLIRTFGPYILKSKNNLDLKKLSEIVFTDKEKLQRLENILHPKVIQYLENEILKVRKKNGRLVVIIPLLFEKKLEYLCDRTITLTSSKSVRIERASKRLKLNKNEVLMRMKHQLTPSEQMGRADDVIRNNGTKIELKNKIGKLIEKFRSI